MGDVVKLNTIKPNDNNMQSFIHCGLCIEEWKANKTISSSMAPRDYARLEVGWTTQGLQIWCKRHECNVMHINFEGAKHPADSTRIPDEEDPDYSVQH